jgi:hypothetical protein
LKAILAIELQNGASWDFGPVEFTSVSVTASTTSNWCGSGSVVPQAIMLPL